MGLIPKFVKTEIVTKWVGESLYLMLLKNTHVPNAGTQQYVSQVSSNEITDTGGIYPAGGVAITSRSWGTDPLLPNNSFLDSLVDISIGPGASLNYRYGIVYANTGNPATSLIRAHVDFLSDQIVTNGTSVIQWNALGIIYVK